MKRSLSLLTLVLLCAGCTQHVFDIKTLSDKSPGELYNLGNKYAKKNPSDAVLAYEEIEKSHPYSDYVANSQVEAGKCYFMMKKYEDAVSILDTFIMLNPTHERVPEALYLLGNIYYVQMPIVKRDQENTIHSIEYFTELCERYPSSEFVEDAQEKIKVLQQHLALHEFRMGMYNQKRKNFHVAVPRYNTIIENYPDTETAQETYLRLIECYLSMGLRDEALAINRILQLKHKDTKWAEYATKTLRK